MKYKKLNWIGRYWRRYHLFYKDLRSGEDNGPETEENMSEVSSTCENSMRM